MYTAKKKYLSCFHGSNILTFINEDTYCLYIEK